MHLLSWADLCLWRFKYDSMATVDIARFDLGERLTFQGEELFVADICMPAILCFPNYL